MSFSDKFCALLSPLYYDLTVKVPEFPRWIHLETTNYCNANCYFCARNNLRRGLGHMDERVFQQAVDEIEKYGVRRLTLHLHGEPLMHPKLFEMIAYAKTKKNISRVEFSTNGSLLNDKNIRGVIDSGLDVINVCMDGATAPTYEHARQGLKFEKTFNNLKNLIEAVDASGGQHPHILIQVIQTPAIVAEMDLFWQQWKPIIQGKEFVEVYQKKYEWWSGSKTDDVENNSSVGEPGPFYVRLPCAMLERQLNVYWNGEVTHCCIDWNGELKVGNFPEQSLMEIWQSQKAQKLRSLVRDGSYAKLPLCSDCMRSTAKRFFSWHDLSKERLERVRKRIQKGLS